MIRYLVFGSGAIGTLLGGLLASVGHHVVFIGRKGNMDVLRERGIRIRGLWGDLDVGPQAAYESVEAIPASERVFDQAFLCVKAFDTEAAIDACLPAIGESTLAISVQNGYGNCQRIAQRIGWERTLGARIITGVELKKPGEVQVTVHADSVRIGHYCREFPMAHLESIAQTLREAGVPTQATDQLEQYIWAKILYNAALNPLGAMLGVTYGALAESEHTRSIMDRILDEAFEVIAAHGIPQFWENADAYRAAFYEQMVPITAAHYPSMLRDLERGRRTEIDALNGAIAQLGREKRVATPVNDAVVSLIRFQGGLRAEVKSI